MKETLPRLIEELFSFDAAFRETRTGTPDAATVEALARFWTLPECEPLRRVLPSPPTDWPTILSELERLWQGNQVLGPFPSWAAMAERSERLAAEDPVAATVVALFAYAGWVPSLRDLQEELRMSPPNPGWSSVNLSLLRNLVAADAIWAARTLAERSFEFLRSTDDYRQDPERLEREVAGHRELLTRIEQRHDECRLELAWALRSAYQAGSERIRAQLSALLWTLGDVVHAQLLGQASYQPSLGVFRQFVELSVERVPHDPFLQYLWLMLKDTGAVDLRRHRALYWRLFSTYQGTPVHDLDQFARATSGMALSHAYAETLIHHFQGHVPDGVLGSYLALSGMHAEDLPPLAPRHAVRLACLTNLVADRAPDDREGEWRRIATVAVEMMGQMSRAGTYDAYDMTLSLPFYYLAGSADGALDGTVRALEELRRARLWYWLTIGEPRPTATETGPAPSMVAQERDLVDRLRGIRVIQLYDEFARGPATWVAQWVTDEYGDLTELFDEGYARETVAQIEQELARIRSHPEAAGSLDRFADALRGDPMGDR